MTYSATEPHALLDAIRERFAFKNDAELARALQVGPPVISKLRHRTLPLGATLIIRMTEMFDMPVKEIRELAAA